MKKKNYSLFIAATLIAFLVVAICIMAISKKDNGEDIMNPNNNQNVQNVNSGEKDPNIPNIEPITPAVEINVERDDEGRKINISDKINKEKMSFGDIDLTDISLSYINGETTLVANVRNNSEVDYPEGMFLRIQFFNENGNQIYQLYTQTSSIMANEQSNIRAKGTTDFSNASTIDVSIVEQ